jgi:Flp pilus assembly protein TadD
MFPNSKPSLERKSRPTRALLLLIVSGLLAWAPCLFMHEWSADDQEVILQSPVITAEAGALEAFKRDYTFHIGASGQWRPLSALSLRMEHSLFGPSSSRPWHQSNVILHILSIALAWLLTRGWRGGALSIGLLLSSAHPILADSVSWVSGRPSMLCVMLGLLGANIHQATLKHRSSLLLQGCSAFLALALPLLAKEDGALFGLLLLGLASSAGRRSIQSTGIGAAFAIISWLWLRHISLGGMMTFSANPILGDSGLWERVLVGIRAAAEALKIAVFPSFFPPRYETGALPSLGVSVLACAGYLLLAAVCVRKWKWELWLFAAPALAFLPFMQIIPGGEVFAPRFAHIPLLFAVPLADRALRKVPSQWLIIGLFALGISAWRAASHYENAQTYWAASAVASPNSPSILNALGLVHQDKEEHEQALSLFERSLSFGPSHSRSWSNKARSHYALGEEESAATALRQAVKTGPSNAIAHVNWGKHLARADRHSEAKTAFIRATELSPGFIHAWRALAETCEELGEFNESREAAKQARRLSPASNSMP